MALRDQPYLALYIQDFMTDEKLNMCSAATQGVYIKLMCVLHKNEEYGVILLKQKYKQTDNFALNFATQLAKLLPFDLVTIQDAICELVDEKVMILDGDRLYQKRMVKDNAISVKRSESGRKGGETTQKTLKNFALAKSKQNTEYEYENENENNFGEEGMEEEPFKLPASGFFSDELDKKILLSQIQISNTTEYIFRTCNKQDISEEEIKNQWEAFKIQALSTHSWYNSFDELVRHFRNSLKFTYQSSKNGTSKTSTGDTGRKITFDKL